MAMNVAAKLISQQLVQGRMQAGEKIAIPIDQTLTEDATGTLVMLELKEMDRHVIANMGTELGNTSSVFPSDLPLNEARKIEWRKGPNIKSLPW